MGKYGKHHKGHRKIWYFKMMFGSDAPIDGLDTYLCNKKGERSIYQDYFNIIEEKLEGLHMSV